MSESNENHIESAIAAGKAAVSLDGRVEIFDHPDAEGVGVPITIDVHGSVQPRADIMAALDARLPVPARRKGVATFTELDSLIQYVERFKNPETTAYAMTASAKIVVVFDEHPSGGDVLRAAWREHRATYECPKSPEWIAWAELDGKPIAQDKFADFLESRLEDLAAVEGYPAPAEVLTMARQLTIRTRGTFTRDFNPTTGDSILVNRNETDAGSTVIPRAFMLGIPVFEGGDRYRVEARIRFAFADGRPMFSYTLHRRKELERAAFDEVRKRIAEATGLPVLAGHP